jgi:sugar/nucleoside kinase (ribokinase family)
VDLAATFGGKMIAFSPSYALYEYDPSELSALLHASDLVVLNEQEANYATRLLDARDWRELSQGVPGSLIVTLAERGAQAYRGDAMIGTPSYSGLDGDVIGAGDAFCAGLLHDMLAGTEFEDAMQFGAMVAAQVVRAREVRTRISEAQIRQQLPKAVLPYDEK